MKLLVFSDSHGNPYYLSRALGMHPDADAAFFLGDGLADLIPFVARPSSPTWFFVKGNCDFSLSLGGIIAKKTDEITLDGVRILYTHGDLYGVKGGTDTLAAYARERGANLVLFGHTHTPCEIYISDYEKPFYLFNPGAASGYEGSFGVIELLPSSLPLLSCGKVKTNNY